MFRNSSFRTHFRASLGESATGGASQSYHYKVIPECVIHADKDFFSDKLGRFVTCSVRKHQHLKYEIE